MDKGIIVKKSKINGKGVFAAKDFKNEEIVLKWNANAIRKSDIKNLSRKEKKYIERFGKKYFLMQPPERYVNHSCEANTMPKNNSDVAICSIKKGEEITSDYRLNGDLFIKFKCKCRKKICRKIIGN